MERVYNCLEEYKLVLLPLFLTISSGVIILCAFFIYDSKVREPITIDKVITEQLSNNLVKAPATHYSPDSSYFESFETAWLSDEFSTDEKFSSESYGAMIAEDAMFQEQTASFEHQYVISNANRELYNIADKYYNVYYGSSRVSPVYPLAVANVETPGRADNDVTWSALFPSKYVDVNKMYTFNVTDVLSLSDSAFTALTTEWSTRDRGALQMSTTYGTGNEYFNNQMSGTEKEKLSKVDTSRNSSWAAQASGEAGDRFYIPDVCLRLSAANTQAVKNMIDNSYRPENDLQLVCQLAMFHHRSGIWYNKNHNKSVGEWKSGEVAYSYSKLISSPDVVKALRQYALDNEDCFNIPNDTVIKLFRQTTGMSFDSFASKDLVCLYPLKVEYAYIKLCLMYAGM